MELGDHIFAIITGGASGLGEATSREFAANNVKVGILDVDDARGTAIARELGGAFAKVDVCEYASVQAGFDEFRSQYGQERILVNCAGVGTSGKIVSKGEPLDPLAFDKVIRINLIGTFYCASIAAAGMATQATQSDDDERGVIINTASIAAYDGQIGQLAYAASKAGIVGMTLPMARDLAKDGIRAVSIAPGIFETPMLQGLPDDIQTSLKRQVPFPHRLGKPSEFAKLVVHIAQNQMINGETIRLDGATRLGYR